MNAWGDDLGGMTVLLCLAVPVVFGAVFFVVKVFGDIVKKATGRDNAVTRLGR